MNKLFLSLMQIIGCGYCYRQMRQVNHDQLMRDILNVQADWDTNFGKLKITQNGSQITGTYPHNNGRIVGVISYDQPTNTWSISGNWYEGAAGESTGKFKFVIAKNALSFTGKYGYGESDSNGGGWDGKRVLVLQHNMAGTWNTSFGTMILEQNNEVAKGSYSLNNGRIEGIVLEGTYSGNWYEDRNGDGIYETRGLFVFYPSLDAKSFTGMWGYGESYRDRGNVTGTKVL